MLHVVKYDAQLCVCVCVRVRARVQSQIKNTMSSRQ